MSANDQRKRPNILITGTPGTGKTTLSQRIAEITGMNHLNVGDLVKSFSLHEGHDEEYDCFILDEDKVCDAMEGPMSSGNQLVDFHSVDFFPERWFDLVLVLRVGNTCLYDRLTERGYNDKKKQENIECEIMQVVEQEARDSYAEEIVHVLENQTPAQFEENVNRVVQWLANWIQNNS